MSCRTSRIGRSIKEVEVLFMEQGHSRLAIDSVVRSFQIINLNRVQFLEQVRDAFLLFGGLEESVNESDCS